MFIFGDHLVHGETLSFIEKNGESLELYSDILLYTHVKFSVGQSSKGVEVKSSKILIAGSVCFYDMNAYFDCCICYHFVKHIVPG